VFAFTASNVHYSRIPIRVRREDMDVRMLGAGRPFLVEIQGARVDISEDVLKQAGVLWLRDWSLCAATCGNQRLYYSETYQRCKRSQLLQRGAGTALARTSTNVYVLVSTRCS
jgi:hypothetical protein